MVDIDSGLITLKEIVQKKYFFNIPIYQRLFVWKEAQIKVLFADLFEAWESKKEIFFLGGVLVVKNKSGNFTHLFDLIDGQQRFTTLWLMSIVLRNALNNYTLDTSENEALLRINFSIRDHATNFFNAVLEDADNTLHSESDELSNIEDALAIIKSLKSEYFKKEEANQNIHDFTTFIFEKVKLIFTEVPNKTDLNKLFEVINNRGVQLQHHEILKASLLSKITNHNERIKYGYLWSACSFMNSYVEKNIKEETGLRIQDYFENGGKEQLASPECILEALSSDCAESKSIALLDILYAETEEETTTKTENDYESEDVRSIISFPMLLLHTLRIYNHQHNKSDIPRIKEKELLQTFEDCFFKPLEELSDTEQEEEIKAFLSLLWKVRYAFDKHVIKWVNEENEDIHLICRLNKQNSDGRYYLQRQKPDSNERLALLQSMLYHSQEMTTQYWLTPFLLKALEKNEHSELFEYLKRLDNKLFTSSHSGSLIERTKDEMKGILVENINLEDLNKSLGVDFPHYWFYKLEFVLWSLHKDKDERWRKFRMTAKNSVEHISPQHPKETDKNRVSASVLNTFGNLALVSRSINSEYSNLPYNEKRQRFKNNNSYKLDSLKMDLIYEKELWNDDLASQHQKYMIDCLKKYLNINE